jgi:hypothetical protein
MGRSVYRQIVPLALAVEAETFDCFTTAERALFHCMIEKLEARTAALQADADRRRHTHASRLEDLPSRDAEQELARLAGVVRAKRVR